MHYVIFVLNLRYVFLLCNNFSYFLLLNNFSLLKQGAEERLPSCLNNGAGRGSLAIDIPVCFSYFYKY